MPKADPMNANRWIESDLGDVLKLNYGWSLPEKKRIPGDYPVYGSNGVVGTHSNPLVKAPGLIVGRKGSAGNVHYSKKPFCPIDTTFYITSEDTPLDIEFLYFFLMHLDLKRILADVGVPGLNREVAYKEKIAFPPSKEEQKKIATVLGLVQRAIEEQDRLIALTTELKKAMMHKLFTEGLHGEPQKMTELGPIPESWEVVKLGDAYDTQLGKMLSQKAHVGDDPKKYVRNKNVQWGRIDLSELLQMDFSEREKAKFLLHPGDLLVCEGGEPGRAAIWKGELEECYYQKALHRLRPKNPRVSNEFLSHWLMYSLGMQNLYGVTGASSTISHLPEIQLKSLPIPRPERQEQDEICEVVGQVDSKLSVSERKRDSYSELFHSLMRQIFRGQFDLDKLELPKQVA